LDLTGINDIPFCHYEEFASENDVVISINRLAVILRTRNEDEESPFIMGIMSTLRMGGGKATLRRDSSVASLPQNDMAVGTGFFASLRMTTHSRWDSSLRSE
jgi:hypothetical protein